MRLAHPITSCAYSIMALRISYDSMNLPAHGPTSTNLPARSPTLVYTSNYELPRLWNPQVWA